jgi:hypothetical protein
VKVDGTQTVTVSGLLEGETVTITFFDEVLVEAKADENGEFEYTFAVGDEAGKTTVKVEGGVPTRVGRARFVIVDGPGGDL